MFGLEKAEATVLAGSSTTAAEALGKMAMFTTLCLRYHIDVKADSNLRDAKSPDITVTGRRRNLDKFLREHVRLQLLGCV